MHYIIWRLIFKCFFSITCRLKVEGISNIPKKGSFIIASNHVSYLDPIMLGVGCSRKDLFFMARHTLFETPFMKWALKRVHVFPVKRGSVDLKAFKESIKLLNDGSGLVLFPEGTRSLDGSLGEPEAGVGFLVVKSGAPVVPAYISGTNIVLPRGQKYIRPSKITVTFGKPVIYNKEKSVIEKEIYFNIAKKTMEDIAILKTPR